MKIIALLAILAALTLGCAGNPQPPAPDTSWQSEVRELRDETRKLQQEVSEFERRQLERQRMVTEPVAQDTEENICNRSPAVQRAILGVLGMSRCSLATSGELFRIETLELASAKPFKKGDFNGLANLSQLNMEIADACGQWDDIAFTDSVVAELPSLGHFELRLYREKLYPDATNAADIADAVFVAINEGVKTEADEHYSESNQDRMEARYRNGSVNVQVYISASKELFPCRRGVAR